jgi:uncharacterized membrane protein
MIEWPELLRWLHVIGAAVLLGTGIGIAFFMLLAHRTRDATLIAHVAGTVVIADFLFTATAVIVQPVTGVLLAHLLGWSLLTPWIVASLALYVLTGLCWLPVVGIQIKLRDLARTSAVQGNPLDQRYHRLFGKWVLLGIPAFISVLAILWLMVARPDL